MNKTVEQLKEQIDASLIDFINQYELVKRSEPTPLAITVRHNCLEEILSIFFNQTKDDCPECKGTGVRFRGNYNAGLWHHKCPKCNGTGKVGEWHPKRLVVYNGCWLAQIHSERCPLLPTSKR